MGLGLALRLGLGFGFGFGFGLGVGVGVGVGLPRTPVGSHVHQHGAPLDALCRHGDHMERGVRAQPPELLLVWAGEHEAA